MSKDAVSYPSPYNEYKDYEGKCVICGHRKTFWQPNRPRELDLSYCSYCRASTMSSDIHLRNI